MPEHRKTRPTAWSEYRRYVASVPGPKIVVVQDLDKPRVIGAFWGEVNANIHRALGCVGTIVDGAIRDLDEMTNAGFKALARRLCVGHAYSSGAVGGRGRGVRHQDSAGAVDPRRQARFLAVPPGDEPRLLEAARFMDTNECQTVIAAARETTGRPRRKFVDAARRRLGEISRKCRDQFGAGGEW